MQKAEIISFCDNAECKETPLSQFKEKGKNAFFGISKSTENSRSDAAAEKILEVVSDSFLRRPSLDNVAFETITGFANQRVYNMQEPRKEFMAHCAMVLVKNEKARGIVSGNGRIYCFCDEKLILSSEERDYQLIGRRAMYKDSFTETSTLFGTVRLMLCCGEGTLPTAGQLEKTLVGLPDVREWKNRILDLQTWEGRSFLLAVLPERKSNFLFFRRE